MAAKRTTTPKKNKPVAKPKARGPTTPAKPPPPAPDSQAHYQRDAILQNLQALCWATEGRAFRTGDAVDLATARVLKVVLLANLDGNVEWLKKIGDVEASKILESTRGRTFKGLEIPERGGDIARSTKEAGFKMLVDIARRALGHQVPSEREPALIAYNLISALLLNSDCWGLRAAHPEPAYRNLIECIPHGATERRDSFTAKLRGKLERSDRSAAKLQALCESIVKDALREMGYEHRDVKDLRYIDLGNVNICRMDAAPSDKKSRTTGHPSDIAREPVGGGDMLLSERREPAA